MKSQLLLKYTAASLVAAGLTLIPLYTTQTSFANRLEGVTDYKTLVPCITSRTFLADSENEDDLILPVTPKLNYSVSIQADLVHKEKEKVTISLCKEGQTTLLGSFSYEAPAHVPYSEELEHILKLEAELYQDNQILLKVFRASESIIGADIFLLDDKHVSKFQVYKNTVTNEVYGSEEYLDHIKSQTTDYNGNDQLMPDQTESEALKLITAYKDTLKENGRVLRQTTTINENLSVSIVSGRLIKEADCLQIVNFQGDSNDISAGDFNQATEPEPKILFEKTYVKDKEPLKLTGIVANPIDSFITPHFAIYYIHAGKEYCEIYGVTDGGTVNLLASTANNMEQAPENR